MRCLARSHAKASTAPRHQLLVVHSTMNWECCDALYTFLAHFLCHLPRVARGCSVDCRGEYSIKHEHTYIGDTQKMVLNLIWTPNAKWGMLPMTTIKSKKNMLLSKNLAEGRLWQRFNALISTRQSTPTRKSSKIRRAHSMPNEYSEALRLCAGQQRSCFEALPLLQGPGCWKH